MVPVQALHTTTIPGSPQAPEDGTPASPETGFTDPDERLEELYEQHRAAIEGFNREVDALWGTLEDPPVATNVPLFQDAFTRESRNGGLGDWATINGTPDAEPFWSWRPPSQTVDLLGQDLSEGWQILPEGEATGEDWGEEDPSPIDEARDDVMSNFTTNDTGDAAAMSFTTPGERGYPAGADTVLLSPVIDLSSLGELRNQIPRQRGGGDAGSEMDQAYHLFYLFLEHRFSFAFDDTFGVARDGARVEVFPADATPNDGGTPLRPHENVLVNRDAQGEPEPYSSLYTETGSFAEGGYEDERAFAGTSDWRVDVFNLTAWAGMQIRLGFHVNTLDFQDEDEFDEHAQPGWFIDQAEVRGPGLPGQVRVGDLLTPQEGRYEVGLPEPAPGDVTFRAPVWNLGSTQEEVDIEWNVRRHGSQGPFSDVLGEGGDTVELDPGDVHIVEATVEVPLAEEEERQIVWFNVTAHPNEPRDSGQIAEGAVQGDPGRGAFPVWVHPVDSLKTDVRIFPGSAPPGVTREVAYTLENRGNVPETVALNFTAFRVPEDDSTKSLVPQNHWWDATHRFEVTVAPGETVEDAVNLTIPSVTEAEVRSEISWWNNTDDEEEWRNTTLEIGAGTTRDLFLDLSGEAFQQADCEARDPDEPASFDLFRCVDQAGSPTPLGSKNGRYWEIAERIADRFQGDGTGGDASVLIRSRLVGFPSQPGEQAARGTLAGPQGFLGTQEGGPTLHQGPLTGLEDLVLDLRYRAPPGNLLVEFHLRLLMLDTLGGTGAAGSGIVPDVGGPIREETQVVSVTLPPPDDLDSCDLCLDAYLRNTWKEDRIDVSRLIRESTGVHDVWRVGLEAVAVRPTDNIPFDSKTGKLDWLELTGVPADRPGDQRITVLHNTGQPLPPGVEQEERPPCTFADSEAGLSAEEECLEAFRGIPNLGDPVGDLEEMCPDLEGWCEFVVGAPLSLEQTENAYEEISGDDEEAQEGEEERADQDATVPSIEQSNPVCWGVSGATGEDDVGQWCAHGLNNRREGGVGDGWKTAKADWGTDEGQAPTTWNLDPEDQDALYLTTPSTLPSMESPVLQLRHLYEGTISGGSELEIDSAVAVFAQTLPIGCSPEAAREDPNCAWSSLTWLEPAGGYPTPFLEREDGIVRPTGGDNQPGDGFYHPTGEFTLPGEDGVRKLYSDSGSGLKTHVFPLTEERLGVEPSNRVLRFAFAPLGGAPDAYQIGGLKLFDAPLDLDLEAGPVHLEAPYDIEEHGPGPGTEVPVRIQVNNTGKLAVQDAELRLDVHRFGQKPVDRHLDEMVCPSEEAHDVETMRTSVALGPGAQTNRTLLWSVPADAKGDWFCVTARVHASGLEDQDPADNRYPLDGRREALPPTQAKQVADVQIRQRVAPSDAPSGVTRSAVVEIRNIGNAPSDDVEVERTIDLLSGSQVRDRTDTWELGQELPPGSSWIRLDDSILDVEHSAIGREEPEFQWTPEESGRYRFDARVLGDGERRIDLGNNRDTSIIDARDVKLKDTADETTSQGLDRRQFDETAWTHRDDAGFRSDSSFWIGGDEDGYADDADAELRLPTVDLSAARSAVLSFMTQFDTEDGYDGGILEASLDGGDTWHALEPSQVGEQEGYPRPIAGSGLLPPGADSSRLTGAFTGTTAQEGTIDGWVPATVPLSQIPGFTRAERLADLSPPAAEDSGVLETEGASSYWSSWVTGDPAKLERFEEYDATLAEPSPIVGDRMWYSGTQGDPGDSDLSTSLDLTVDLAANGASTEDIRFQFWDWRDGVTPANRHGTGGTFDVRVTDALGNTFPCQPEPGSVCQLETATRAGREPITEGAWTLRNLTITPQPLAPVAELPRVLSKTSDAVDQENETAYVFGGEDGDGELRSTILELGLGEGEDGTWEDPEPVRSLFPGRWGSTLAWDDEGDKGFSFGGQDGPGVFAGDDSGLSETIVQYNRSEGDSEDVDQTLPGPRRGSASFWNASSDTAYILGGYGCEEVDSCTPEALDQTVIYHEQNSTIRNKTSVLETARHGAALAWHPPDPDAPDGGIAYIIGGEDDEDDPLATIEAFTPHNTTAWTLHQAELPGPRTNATAVWDSDEEVAYIFGGEDQGELLDDVLRFDPEADEDNQVETVAHLPEPRSSASAVWDHEANVAYVVGGHGPGEDGKQALRSIYSFDPADERDPFAYEAGLSDARVAPSTAWNETHRELIVVGGLKGWEENEDEPDEPLLPEEVPVFSAEDGGMQADVLKLPSARAATSAVRIGESAYVFGGTCHEEQYDGCEEGFLGEIVEVTPHRENGNVTDRVRVISDIAFDPPRANTAAASDGEKAYVFGGECANQDCYLGEIAGFDPGSESEDAALEEEDLLDPRAGSSAVWDSSASTAYVIGGANKDGFVGEILEFDPEADEEAKVGPAFGDLTLPEGRAQAAAVFDEGEGFVYLIGGENAEKSILRIHTEDEGSLTEIPLERSIKDASAIIQDAGGPDILVLGGGTDEVLSLVPTHSSSLEEVTLTFEYQTETPSNANNAGPIWEIPGPAGNRGWAVDGVRLLAGEAHTDSFAEVLEEISEREGDWTEQGDDEHVGWSAISSPEDHPHLAVVGGWRIGASESGPPSWKLQPDGRIGFPPNMDTRLVTPVVDLSNVGTDDAALTIEHAYRFTQDFPDNDDVENIDTNVEGGALEVQTFNETTGRFDAWKTLLPQPNALDDVVLCEGYEQNPKFPQYPGCIDNPHENYHQFLFSTKRGPLPPRDDGEGRVLPEPVSDQLDPYSVLALDINPPFPKLETEILENREGPAGYAERTKEFPSLLITGEGGAGTPRTDVFDLSPYIGERIRLAFHTWSNPFDHCHNAGPECEEEFWEIYDARVDTDLVDGRPVDLRFRFGSDEQVSGRGWGIDDVQLGVTEYSRNLALDVNDSTLPDAVEPEEAFWINGTVQNKGTSPRTGFGVRLVSEGFEEAIEVETFNGTGFEDGSAGPLAVGPAGSEGDQQPFSLRVKTNSNLTKHLSTTGESEVTVPFELQLVERPRSDASLIFDEVTGNKAHRFETNASFLPSVDLSLAASTLQAGEGEPIALEAQLNNNGPTEVEPTLWINATRDRDLVHAQSLKLELGQGERTTLKGEDLELRLEAAGTYGIQATLVAGAATAQDSFTVHVGEPATAFGTGFEGRLDDLTATQVSHVETCDNPPFVDRDEDREAKAPAQWRTTSASAREGRQSAVFGAAPGHGTYAQASDSGLVTSPISLRSLDGPRLTFSHQPNFAPGDGGIVEMRFVDTIGQPLFTDQGTDNCDRYETGRPNAEGWFLLQPEGGYGSETKSKPHQPPPAFQGGGGHDGSQNALGDSHPVFRSEETTWREAVFRLDQQVLAGPGEPVSELLERHEVEFRLRATSQTAGETGAGWLVDGLAVTSHAASVEPTASQLPLKDGARKTYTFTLDNPTNIDEIYDLEVDWNATTLPTETVDLLTDHVTVPSGKTGDARVAVEIPIGESVPSGGYTLALRAVSGGDPLVSDVGRMTLDVETIPHADLVGRLETGGTQFEVGSTATLGAVVLNNGDEHSASTKARFIVSQPDGSDREVIDEVSVPPLPSPGARSETPQTLVATNWTVPRANLGDFVLDLEVDPSDRVVELDEENNLDRRSIEVIPLQRPDLEVLPTDVEMFTLSGATATSVRPFDLVEVIGTVHNVGNQPAHNARANVLLGASLTSQVDLGTVPAGASETFSVNVFAPSDTTDLQIIARTPDPEFLETNNEASATLVVQESRFSTQLEPQALTLPPGDPTQANLTITNEGSTPTLLTFQALAEHVHVETTPERLVLPPGTTETIPVTLLADTKAEHGEREILLAGLNAEGDREVAVPIDASVPRQAHHDVTVSPAARAPGSNHALITVENGGNVPDKLVLSLHHKAFQGSPQASAEIDPGQAQRVPVPFTTPRTIEPGTYHATLQVTSREGFSTTAPVEITIQPTPTITVSSQAIKEGSSPIEYSLELTNEGNVPATPFLQVTEEPPGWDITLDAPADNLEPGERTTGTLKLSATGEPSPGILDLPLRLNAASPHADTSEHNQTLRAGVDVRPASLTFENVERTPRFAIEEGARVEYTASLVNEGSGPAAPAEAWLYVDDELADRVTVDRLPAHSEATVNLTYTAPGGEHAVVLSADPVDGVQEFNETNNDLAFTLYSSSTFLGVPGLPLVLLLSVLLLVALRRRER